MVLPNDVSSAKPNTLGYHRDMAAIVLGAGGKAVAWLDEQIAKAPHGRDEEVMADESQVVYLLGMIEFGGANPGSL